MNDILKEIEAQHRKPAGDPEANTLYNEKRTYDHLNPDCPISMDDYSDEDIAHWVRMLLCTDWAHEAIVVAARDRILCLVKEKKELENEIEHLHEKAAGASL